jgi:hypothetical protein
MRIDRDARRVERQEDLRLLLMARRDFRIGLAHQDRDLAARIASARRPPLAAVDHVMIAIALDAGFDVGRVGGGHRRLGHQEGGADFAVHQRLQPLLLLLLGAVAHEHFHVAGIGRRAIEHFGRPGDAAHLLPQQRVFEIGQAGAAKFLIFMLVRRHEHVPQTFGLRLLLQLLENRNHLPALALRILLGYRSRHSDRRACP